MPHYGALSPNGLIIAPVTTGWKTLAGNMVGGTSVVMSLIFFFFLDILPSMSVVDQLKTKDSVPCWNVTVSVNFFQGTRYGSR